MSSRTRAVQHINDDGKRIKIKFSVVDTSPESEPAMLRFPHGRPASIAASNADVCFQRVQHQSKKHRIAMVASTPKATYVGSNFGTETHKRNGRLYSLGVYDPTEQSCDLIPVHHIYAMRPANIWAVTNDSGDHATTVDSKNERYAHKHALVDHYGSKKTKAAMRSMAAARVDVGTKQSTTAVVNALLNKRSRASAFDSQAAIIEKQRHILPPFDLDAETVKKIFTLYDKKDDAKGVVPYGIWKDIKSDAFNAFIKGDSESLPKTTSKIARAVLEYAKDNIGDNDKKRHKYCRMAQYIQYAILFKHSPRSRKHLFSETLDADQKHIGDYFSRKFAKRGRIADDGLDLSLFAHVAVMTLFAFRYRVPARVVDSLATELSLSTQKCRQVFAECGCRTEGSTANTKHFVLHAPLKFPRISRIGRR
jgi:A49-like RNA polymerase I associated factor